MKVKRSILVLALAVLFCTSMVLSASAVAFTPAGIYGKLFGTVANTPDGNFLATTTSISKNPDNARLKIEADFTNGIETMYSYTGSSSRGATSYSQDLPIFYDGESTSLPVAVYTAHSVQNGTGDEAYTCYGYTELEY